jgi:hypothetical protein
MNRSYGVLVNRHLSGCGSSAGNGDVGKVYILELVTLFFVASRGIYALCEGFFKGSKLCNSFSG